MTAIWSMGRSKRNNLLHYSIASPGPAAYNPKPRYKQPNPAWTIHKAKETNTNNDTPGPGAYEHIINTHIAKIMIKAKPKSIYNIDKDIPGPGRCSPDHKKIQRKITNR
jgi:hypothetical protein